MDSKVVIVKTNTYEYFKKAPFRPSTKYPEYIFDEMSESENCIYDMVREGFRLMNWDVEHYGRKEWNPLVDYVKQGNTVVLKPNLVMDFNAIVENGTDCLYTQPSLVAAVIDYVIIALQGKGSIIVGDAPMQECDFQRLVEESGYLKMIQYYQNKLRNTDISIRLVDFRELRSKEVGGIRYSDTSRYEYSGLGSEIVSLGEDSLFAGQSKYLYENIRITNYDPTLLKLHHNEKVNEYKICKEILLADAIINLPKPKVHRKAGVTIALKNLVGINCRKEYLPHHTKGSKTEGGDEYLTPSLLKRIQDWLYDKRNFEMQSARNYRKAKILQFFINRIATLMNLLKSRGIPIIEGNWWGNDTISRTITDLNRILFYADKNGIMQEKMQRKAIIVADMIVSGEKEGPVAPTAKDVGIIAIGENPVCFDEVVATLMGAKLDFINTTNRARNFKGKYKIVSDNEEAIIISNEGKYNNKKIKDLDKSDLLYFIPTSGWKQAFMSK